MYSGLISSVVVFEDDLLRNIKGIRESQALFDDLSDDAGEYAVAHATESRDTALTDRGTITRPFDYGTAISYPFIHSNWQQTRFSDGSKFGVWYGALDLETTIHESVYHWRKFNLDSFPDVTEEIIADRRVVKVRCQGILVSLIGKETEWPTLVAPEDYSFTNTLGAYMKAQNQNGLLTRSARCPGTNAAVFTPSVLSDPRDHCFLTYTFCPATDGPIRVEREPGKLLVLVPH